MSDFPFPQNLENRFFFLVGIKGTGMAALAEILTARGARVEGCDVAERFYTDAILEDLKIPVVSGFHAEILPEDAEGIIYSAAYSPEHQAVLAAALERELPLWEYTHALGALSEGLPAAGISGVHGKTTTTAMAGEMVKALGLPSTVLVGSAVGGFGNRSTLVQGNGAFIAETCEYRRHFLRFHPDFILLTSVEADHLDYFKDYEDIREAFCEYVRLLPPGGTLIYCAGQAGAVEVASLMEKERRDINFVPYGFGASGPFGIKEVRQDEGLSLFKISRWDRAFSLRVPGRHTVENAVGALALLDTLYPRVTGEALTLGDVEALAEGLENFAGTRRRSEIVGEADGILFMDDYAHHPSAIKTTLKGLKEFYPRRRLVVDFMSHTYSRTAGLFEDFADSFSDADLVILHKIYGSAREKEAVRGSVSGRGLYQAVAKRRDLVYFTEEVDDAEGLCENILRAGDLFLTMGAGNNWTLGRKIYENRKLREESR